MFKVLLGFLIVYTLSQSVYGQDHLYPDAGFWSYNRHDAHFRIDARDSLYNGFGNSYYFRAVCLGILGEWAVSVECIKSKDFSIVFESFVCVTRPEEPIWIDSMESPDAKQERLRKTKFQRFVKKIPHDIAWNIHAATHPVISKTRYPNDYKIGIDGATYYFTTLDKVFNPGLLNEKNGWVWSPSKGKTRLLVDLSYSLIRYAEVAPGQESKVLDEINNLIKKF